MAKKRRAKNSKVTYHTHPEIRGIILLALSSILLLSLVSFVYGKASENWLGYIGYAFAFITQYLFGLASYILIGFSIFLGWRLLCNKPIDNFGIKAVYLSVVILSSCLLLNVIAETHPHVGEHFSDAIYSKVIQLKVPKPIKKTRYYLGGAPAYYLYKDLPLLSLYKLLSNVGVTLVFSTMLLISSLLLTQIRLMPIVYFFRDRVVPVFLAIFAPKNFVFAYKNLKPVFTKIPFNVRPKQITKALEKKSKVQQLPNLSEPEDIAPYLPPNVKASSDAVVNLHDEHEALIEPTISKTVAKESKREKAIQEQKVYNGDYSLYQIPDSSLLTPPMKNSHPSLKRDLRKQAEVLEETLLSFGIEAKVGEINCGPTITSFEVHPAVGVKVQKIKALENDIALNLQAKSIRIIAPIPGKAVVGIEIPSLHPQEVNFQSMLEEYRGSKRAFHIPILLGKTVTGDNVMTDLVRMPHCIIAGATGTGKSVCINTIVMSILMNCKPDEVKLVLIDPKKVELTPFTRLPHMLAPVITEPEGAIAALKWLVKEMENRYEILKTLGARNILSFNTRKRDEEFENSLDIEVPEKMMYIVCIIDELADLMMMSSNEIEMPIARIAQMARAVGIHMILATQRPSREVITGLIKANFPSRISFKVASRINSQIVLDEIGAESLLGNGDMLFIPPGTSTLLRTQGCFIRDQDIHSVVDKITQQSPANYLIESFDDMGKLQKDTELEELDDVTLDPLYDQALDLVKKTGSISTTFIQRKLKIGYARAASIMDQLEDRGVITPADGSKPRKLLVNSKPFDNSSLEF